jgi:hypothetical protein
MVEELYAELSDDGEAINRNRDALSGRLDWLVDQTFRDAEAADASRAQEFSEHCDTVARCADGAASVLSPDSFSYKAFSDCRDEAQQGSSMFLNAVGADEETAKAYLYAGWEQCKKAYGTLAGI